MLLGAAAFALLGLTARGPLGVLRVCGPRVHAVGDVVVAGALGLAPILPALRPDLPGVVVVEFVALAWIRVATLTRYRGPVGTRRLLPAPHASAAPERGPDAPAAPGLAAGVVRGLGRTAARSLQRVPGPQQLEADARRAAKGTATLWRVLRRDGS